MSNRSFLVMIVLIAGLLHNHKKLLHWINPPMPMDYSKQQIMLYSTTWCGYCAKTREFFAENRIPYQDIDVEHTEQGRRDYAQFGASGVPIVLINHKTMIVGYDTERIAFELGID